MMNNLNIGSIVEVRDEIKKVMIIGKNENLDYIGVLFPMGYINSNENIMFKKDDIVKVYSIGYQEGV